MSKSEQANHDDSPIPMAKEAHSARSVLSEEAIRLLSDSVCHLPFDPRWMQNSGQMMNGAHGDRPPMNTLPGSDSATSKQEPHRPSCGGPIYTDGHGPQSADNFRSGGRSPIGQPQGLPSIRIPDGGGRSPIEQRPGLPSITIPGDMGNGGQRSVPTDVFNSTGNEPKPNILKPRTGQDSAPTQPHWPPMIYVEPGPPRSYDPREGIPPNSQRSQSPFSDTGAGRIMPPKLDVNRPKDGNGGCFGDFDQERLKNLEDWIKDHVITLKPNSETKLKTGDTIKTTDKAQIMTMPNGDVLTVYKDGTYELKSTTAKVTEHKFDDGTKACVIKYPNGDNIHFGTDHVTKQGRIFAVERGKTFVGIERSEDDDPKKR